MKNRLIPRKVIFHGSFADRYIPEIEVCANSMFALCNIIFKQVFPKLLNEKFILVMEDNKGIKTHLFDREQELLETQTVVHIVPDTDGSVWWWIPYLVMAIISVGVALLLAPKLDVNADNSASGANWATAENVIGQGGVMPVLLGERLVGSRVVSHGIDNTKYLSKSALSAGGITYPPPQNQT